MPNRPHRTFHDSHVYKHDRSTSARGCTRLQQHSSARDRTLQFTTTLKNFSMSHQGQVSPAHTSLPFLSIHASAPSRRKPARIVPAACQKRGDSTSGTPSQNFEVPFPMNPRDHCSAIKTHQHSETRALPPGARHTPRTGSIGPRVHAGENYQPHRQQQLREQGQLYEPIPFRAVFDNSTGEPFGLVEEHFADGRQLLLLHDA